ncbi:MAG TPA: hypothetical protein ENN09_04005, partial [Planctomycetes bacterium]|nr:hypothetical protein [Planctomycetota bacterium]
KTIGFGARALSPDDEPKYLNSPDTPIFKKGMTIYGLNHARRFPATCRSRLCGSGVRGAPPMKQERTRCRTSPAFRL